MACFHPYRVFQMPDGAWSFRGGKDGRELLVNCGRCVGCRVQQKQEWVGRLCHEAKMHDVSVFVTLTYEGDVNPSLNYRDVQLFLKRLRKTGRKVRFFCCGEYGEQNERPHWHLILFGVDFPDREFFGKGTYGSAELRKLWPHGYSSFGFFTAERAKYVAGYVTKKLSKVDADVRYKKVDTRTGEEVSVHPEFARMSLKPALGIPWLRVYADEVFNNGSVIADGAEVPIPRAYSRALKKEDPDGYARLKKVWFDKQVARPAVPATEWSRERLATKEGVAKARLKLSTRKL